MADGYRSGFACFVGRPNAGKSITGHGTYFVKTEDGKIKEFHSHPDAAGMMMQLGLMGTPA